jgi:hypothetical protein
VEIALQYLKGRKSKDLNRPAISKVCGVFYDGGYIFFASAKV